MTKDTLTLDITPGGIARCTAPRATEHRSLMFSLMVISSLQLQCGLVVARNWLPGMHLFVQAIHHLQRSAQAPMAALPLEWPRMERDSLACLDRSDDRHPQVIYLSSAFASCCLARPHGMPPLPEPAFTFDVQWGLPSGLLA